MWNDVIFAFVCGYYCCCAYITLTSICYLLFVICYISYTIWLIDLIFQMDLFWFNRWMDCSIRAVKGQSKMEQFIRNRQQPTKWQQSKWKSIDSIFSSFVSCLMNRARSRRDFVAAHWQLNWNNNSKNEKWKMKNEKWKMRRKKFIVGNWLFATALEIPSNFHLHQLNLCKFMSRGNLAGFLRELIYFVVFYWDVMTGSWFNFERRLNWVESNWIELNRVELSVINQTNRSQLLEFHSCFPLCALRLVKTNKRHNNVNILQKSTSPTESTYEFKLIR